MCLLSVRLLGIRICFAARTASRCGLFLFQESAVECSCLCAGELHNPALAHTGLRSVYLSGVHICNRILILAAWIAHVACS
jgi:hypothetical protein